MHRKDASLFACRTCLFIHSFIHSFIHLFIHCLTLSPSISTLPGMLALLYRCSSRFKDHFRVEELKDIQNYLQGEFDAGSEYQYTESASRAQSRIEHFYGRSVSEKDADSQYSGNGMSGMGRH